MPATPYLRVDGARLWRNIERTAARAAAAGVALLLLVANAALIWRAS